MMPTTVTCHVGSHTLSCRPIFAPNTISTDIWIVGTHTAGCTHVISVQPKTRRASYSLETICISEFFPPLECKSFATKTVPDHVVV